MKEKYRLMNVTRLSEKLQEIGRIKAYKKMGEFGSVPIRLSKIDKTGGPISIA